MKIKIFNIPFFLMLKKYVLFSILLSTLIATVTMAPQYYLFAKAEFVMFSHPLDVFIYFLLTFPGYFCESFIYALVFSFFILVHYIHSGNIALRISLSANSIRLNKYILLALSLLMITSVFLIKENIVPDLDTKAGSLIYKSELKKAKYNFPVIFMGNDQLLFAEGYEKAGGDEYFRNITIDRLAKKNREIIFAQEARLSGNRITLIKGVANKIGTGVSEDTQFDELTLDFSLKSGQNLIVNNILFMNIDGLNKIEMRNNLYNTGIIKSIKRSRIVTFINNLILVLLVFLIFFNFATDNFIVYLAVFLIMLAVYYLFEYPVKNLFINLAFANDLYLSGIFISFGLAGAILKAGLYLNIKFGIVERISLR